jgi:hypothetical protein
MSVKAGQAQWYGGRNGGRRGVPARRRPRPEVGITATCPHARGRANAFAGYGAHAVDDLVSGLGPLKGPGAGVPPDFLAVFGIWLLTARVSSDEELEWLLVRSADLTVGQA